MADPQTDAKIAAMWPKQWARANDSSLRNRSKARQQIRQRFALANKHSAFVAANPEARCGNCEHQSFTHHTQKARCDLDSDFHGDQLVSLQDVCTRWRARAALKGE